MVALLAIFLFGFAATAQMLKGTVVDAVSRQPLENVSIISEEKQSINTITDQYGNFSLRINDPNTNLLVSCLGYKFVSIPIATTINFKIEMQPDVLNLKDVAVLNKSQFSKFSTLAKIDLDLKPVRNTQELLRLMPGLFIAQHAGGGKAEQIFLRGFDVDHGTDVQLSVDGMPINMVSHAHGQGYADAHFIIPETINNIDFGAGPYFTDHGNFNTAGYVSFSTFKNIPKSIFQLEAGRFNSLRSLLMLDLIKKRKDKESAYIAADLNYSDGPTIDKQRFKRLNLFAKYNLAFSENTQLSASASLFSSKWDASGQVPDRAVKEGLIDRFGSIDPTEGGNTERYNANIVLSHRFAKGSNWQNQLFYSRNIFNLYSNFTFFLEDPVNGDEINQAEKRNMVGYNSIFDHKYYFKNGSLLSTYGAGVRYDATDNSRLSNVVKRKFLGDIKSGDIKELNAFGFIRQQLNAGRFLIDAGVRIDHFNFDYFDKLAVDQNPSQSKTILSPKLNIQYTVNKKVQLFIKTGKGFHSNDSRVVVANNGKEILPAAYGADLGIILKPTDKLLLNIAAWYLYLQQEFVYVGDAGVVEPSGKTSRQGVDVILRYQFTKNLLANMNYNFTKARAIGEPKNTDYIPLAPVATSTGGIYYKAKMGLNGGLSYRYIKNRPTNEDNSIVAKGYFLLDAALNYTKKNYEIGIAFENLLNTKWNEAQFATESRLMNEAVPVEELHYTPGTPFFARLKFAVFF